MLKVLFSIKIAQTSEFAPDEFWQSTEVAYYKLFGEGHLTWEWVAGIRSYIIPTVIYVMYYIGLLTGLVPGPVFMVRKIFHW